MTSYVIKINEASKKAKYLVELIKEMAKTNSSISFEKLPNKETLKSFNDAKKGKIYAAKNVDDLFHQLEQ